MVGRWGGSICPSVPYFPKSSAQAGVKNLEVSNGGGSLVPHAYFPIFDAFEFHLWWLLPGNQLLGWEWERKGKDPQDPLGAGSELPPLLPPSTDIFPSPSPKSASFSL